METLFPGRKEGGLFFRVSRTNSCLLTRILFPLSPSFPLDDAFFSVISLSFFSFWLTCFLYVFPSFLLIHIVGFSPPPPLPLFSFDLYVFDLHSSLLATDGTFPLCIQELIRLFLLPLPLPIFHLRLHFENTTEPALSDRYRKSITHIYIYTYTPSLDKFRFHCLFDCDHYSHLYVLIYFLR